MFQMFLLAKGCLLVCSVFSDIVSNLGCIPVLIREVTHLKVSIQHCLLYVNKMFIRLVNVLKLIVKYLMFNLLNV